MSINTHQSLSGFVASEPVVSPEGNTQRLDMTVGQVRHARTSDGGVVRAEPDLCHLVLKGVPAIRAAGQFRVGDQFVAEGRMSQEKVWNADTGQSELRPVFHASRIGPDTASTSYELLLQRRIHPKPAPLRGLTEPSLPTGATPAPPSQPPVLSL
jgi:hypothetical protein